MNKESIIVKRKVIVEIEERVFQVENIIIKVVGVDGYKIVVEKRNELNQMYLNNYRLVLQANSIFYRAFSDNNL